MAHVRHLDSADHSVLGYGISGTDVYGGDHAVDIGGYLVPGVTGELLYLLLGSLYLLSLLLKIYGSGSKRLVILRLLVGQGIHSVIIGVFRGCVVCAGFVSGLSVGYQLVVYFLIVFYYCVILILCGVIN